MIYLISQKLIQQEGCKASEPKSASRINNIGINIHHFSCTNLPSSICKSNFLNEKPDPI